MSKDLETYVKCLDGAIIAFHSLKMERINIILQELWSTVYDGNDIETIRIKSEPMEKSLKCEIDVVQDKKFWHQF
uniref:Uncharacterized protein n=1 Tax=Panagrolaimus superbus TaxID=310955 RepID=A0A914YPJ5_9BILA